MKTLKFSEIQAILAVTKYAIFETATGQKIAVNSQILKTSKIRFVFHHYGGQVHSKFVSWSECSLNKYINKKSRHLTK